MQENIKNHEHIYIMSMKINEFIQKYRTVKTLVPG